MPTTPEELAEEYVLQETTGSDTYDHGLRNGFLDGHLAATPKWVNVKDNLPSTYTQYLVHITNGERGYMEALYWNPYQAAWSGLIYGHTVTHWMEMPEGPKDE